MDWMQFLMMLGAFVGLFTWNRSESRSDMRHLEALVNAQLNGMREESKTFQQIMANESKDFHGRLCAIEERNRSK